MCQQASFPFYYIHTGRIELGEQKKKARKKGEKKGEER